MSTRLDLLGKARDRLEALLATSDERSAPAISRELRAVLDELAMLTPAAPKAKGTVLDEFSARRAKQAKTPARPARRKV